MNYVTENVLTTALEVYPEINLEWLVLGRGDMFTASDVAGGIPVYDMSSPGGTVIGFLAVVNSPNCDGALYARGDSMAPLIKSGDIVAYRTLPPDMSSVVYDDIYIVGVELGGEVRLIVGRIREGEGGKVRVEANDGRLIVEFGQAELRSLAVVKMSVSMLSIS